MSLPRRSPAVEIEPTPGPVHAQRSLGDRLPLRWVIALAVSWPSLFALGGAIEPTPANPDAAPPLFVDLLIVPFLFGLLGAGIGLASRRRWAAAASLVAAVALLGGAIACPTSGHHTEIGLWWFGQLMIAATLIDLSRRALRATGAPRR